MAPWKRTIPLETETAGARVVRYVDHPFASVKGVYPLDDSANQAPSSDVKPWASANVLCASMVTAPLDWMIRRPLAALTEIDRHVGGRRRRHPGGQREDRRRRAAGDRPLEANDPPDVGDCGGAGRAYVVHPFCSVSAVYPLADTGNDAPSSDVNCVASVVAPGA